MAAERPPPRKSNGCLIALVVILVLGIIGSISSRVAGPTTSNATSAEGATANQAVVDGSAASPQAVERGSSTIPSNQYSKKLFSLSGKDRLAILSKVIGSAGERCDDAIEAVLKGHHKHTDFWRVTCNDSGDWMVSVGRDSSTKVLSCTVMRQLGDDCRKQW